MKKALLIGVVLLFILNLGGCAFFDSMCGNTLISEKVSPDGTRKAVAYYTDCGATTAYTPNVSIIKAEESLPKQPMRPANVFLGAYAAPTVGIKWTSDTTLLICYTESHRQEENARTRSANRYENITITYALGKGSPWECDQ